MRVIVAAHELMHTLGAVDGRSAPNGCASGHVCDGGTDLMTATLENGPLESRVLDVGRNDYYGHGGSWDDVQDSRFLERLDSPGQGRPGDADAAEWPRATGPARCVSWRLASDDIGPVSYRVYRDGTSAEEVSGGVAIFEAPSGARASMPCARSTRSVA